MNTVYPANEEFPIPCTHCRRVVDVAAEFTMYNDYGDEEAVRLCADCLKEAMGVMRPDCWPVVVYVRKNGKAARGGIGQGPRIRP